MNNKKSLTASLENYLKAIFYIVEEKKAARVKDISKYLNIGPSSVSEALKILAERKVINYEPYGIVTLTDEGHLAALEIIKKNDIIKNFFENVLSVDTKQSELSAEQMKHSVSEDVLSKFVMFLEFMQSCSCKEPKWMRSFKYYSVNGEFQSKCQKCIAVNKENPESHSNNHCCGQITE